MSFNQLDGLYMQYNCIMCETRQSQMSFIQNENPTIHYKFSHPLRVRLEVHNEVNEDINCLLLLKYKHIMQLKLNTNDAANVIN